MGKKQSKKFTPSEWSVFCHSYNGHFSVSPIVRRVLILLLAILLESDKEKPEDRQGAV